jgi:non-ribosomal peptide synthetase-like protein
MAYSAWRLCSLGIALALAGLGTWWVERLARGLSSGTAGLSPVEGWSHVLVTLATLGTILFAALLLAALVPVIVVSRLGRLVVKPGQVYPLYGLRFMVARTVARVGSSEFYNSVLGDSALIVGFLRLIGYDLADPVQTGVNFGLAQKQGDPRLCRVGRGTLVSDGLTMMNLDYSSTSFTVSSVTVGADSFLGNDVRIPAQARLGANCLLATKVLVPVDGRRRAGTGLLGSPPFEIPRSRPADRELATFDQPQVRARQLRRKLRSNLGSMAGYVVARYVLFVVLFVTVLSILLARDSLGLVGLAAMTLSAVAGLLVAGVAFAASVEWAGLGFRRLRPRHCSIYDPYYWSHERHWKWGRLLPPPLFNGTPYRSLVWRLLGVRIGKRVVDEGCLIPERSLTSIGDDCCLNERATIQGHSLEDGVFTSDNIELGPACTVGVGGFVHYGTRLGRSAVLGADSFLLKGEVVPSGEVWAGNPARAVQVVPATSAPDPAARPDR